MSINKNYLVEKRNILNEIRSNPMNLHELRFFSIYLAKINARDVSTRVVRFSLDDFQKIMELEKLNLNYLKDAADDLLCKVIGVTLEDGTVERFQLFKKYRITKDEKDEWYVEIDAHDDALPLMFEFKEKYFTYELWNALILKSSNQLRMYEILKQYEYKGERVVSLDELKELLGLNASDYPRYDNFKARVLDVCQKALETYTDIKFTYEPAKKNGKGGKIRALKFNIFHNNNYVDKILLDDFINAEDRALIETVFEDDVLAFLAEACEKEFSEAEMKLLRNYIVKIVPGSLDVSSNGRQLKMYDYLKLKYDQLNWRAEQTEIKNRFAYLKKMIEVDVIEND